MTLDPSVLLAGPRGRRLCLEVLLAQGDGPAVQRAAWAVSWAARPFAEHTGTIIAIAGDATSFVEPEVSPAEAAAALRAVQPRIEPAVLDTALAAAVDSAAYWQPPSGRDVLASTEEVTAALEPVAESVARDPSIRCWTEPVARAAQAQVFWEAERPSAEPPRSRLSRWRAAMEAEERQFATEYADRDVSGAWWSTPPQDLPRSTRTRPGGEPLGLTLVEDSLGWETARVQPVRVPEGEVIEIDGPDAWARLCRRHPLVVTASRRYVWEMTTGRVGAWVQPDWAAVADEAVGVHLTVVGYLTTAGRVVDLGDGGASLLAGWDPDETFWFDTVAPSRSEETWAIDVGASARRWGRT